MKKIIAVVALVAVIAAVYVFATSSDKTSAPAKVQAKAVPVSVLSMEKRKVDIQHDLPGRVTPFRQSQVRPQVNGIITQRLFEEGADVKKGDQLYQIDDARYKATYNSAVADLKSAQSSAKSIQSKEKRYRGLVDVNAVSQQEYDDVAVQLEQANAAIAVAQSAVDLAKVNLNYTQVYSPISGRIGKSLVTEGALVTANQAQHLAVITQLDPVYVDIQQSGLEAIELRQYIADKENIPVRVKLGEGSEIDYPHAGELKFSEVTIDETSGSISLRAEMPNPEGTLLTGLFVTASLDLGEFDLMLVPQRATIRQPDGSLSVWVVDEEEKAQPRTITARYEYQGHWVVRTGLKAGDRVIVEGYQKVRPGVSVNPSPWQTDKKQTDAEKRG